MKKLNLSFICLSLFLIASCRSRNSSESVPIEISDPSASFVVESCDDIGINVVRVIRHKSSGKKFISFSSRNGVSIIPFEEKVSAELISQ